MAARQIIVPGAMPSRDANGRSLAAYLRFYAPDTTTPKTVYTSSALTTAHPFPLPSDSAGRFPSIWADEDHTFDVAWSRFESDALIAGYSDIQPLSDAVMASVGLAEDAAEEAAEDAEAAETSRFSAMGFASAASASAGAAAASAVAAGGYATQALAAIETIEGYTGGGVTNASNVNFAADSALAVIRSVLAKLREFVSVGDYGAVGDGVTDDTTAIQRACSYVQGRGGGIVYLPPTGAAYRITDTIALGNGVKLCGANVQSFPGATAINAQWTAAGSWLAPEHVSNPAVKLQGHGSAVEGICFIHDQPIPSGSWTPTTYGYCISNQASHTAIKDILIVNASHGIEFAYTQVSGGGTAVTMQNVMCGAFVVRLRTSCVNDTMYWHNFHGRNLWYSSNALVANHTRLNTKGWRCGYTDNLMANGLEFFQEHQAIYFEDETCLGNTHSLFNATIDNVQFNLVSRAMEVENTTTVVTGQFANVVTQSYTDNVSITSTDRLFKLGSDNVRLAFRGFWVNDAGGGIMALGNGTGGLVTINGLDVTTYSSAAAGQTGFAIEVGSILTLHNISRFKKAVGAGSYIGGAGRLNSHGFERALFSVYGSAPTTTLGTAWADLTTPVQTAPSDGRYLQARLLGEVYVSTPQTAGVLALRMSGHTEITEIAVAAATTGWKAVDSNWIDLADDVIPLDRLQISGTTSVVVNNAEMSLLLR